MRRTRQSSGWKRCGVATSQVCGLPRRCATYVARLAMTGKEASVAGGAGLNCAGGCLAFLFF